MVSVIGEPAERTTRPDYSAYRAPLSELYDLVYLGRGKDFASEARVVADLIRARRPGAASLLDVGCGTGEHLATWRTMFAQVEGVDISPDMIAVARAKLPGVPIHLGDMRDFDLGRTVDGICTLFSTLGYLPSTAELDAAVANLTRHLPPGGVLVAEPWWFPERFLDGHIGHDVVRKDGATVVRVVRTTTVDGTARLEAHYIAADGQGIRSFVHVQRFTLFAFTDYRDAFLRAGCEVEYLPDPGATITTGRGLFVGVRQVATAGPLPRPRPRTSPRG